MTGPAFGPDGLVPGVVQDARTGEVLMVAYLNEAALTATQQTGHAHFWSRSRQTLWKKGETSGNTLRVVDIRADCDADSLLLLVEPAGPACHTGARTCFEEPAQERPSPAGFASLEALWQTILDRAATRPQGSYTTSLLAGGVDATGRKVLEEAAEVVSAAVAHQRAGAPAARVHEEAADLIYHLLVLLAERRLDAQGALDVLAGRAAAPEDR